MTPRKHEVVGQYLKISAVVAVACLVFITATMINDWLGSNTMQNKYALSWVNSILGLYALVAFFGGCAMRAKSTRWRSVWLTVLCLGAALFLVSGISEISRVIEDNARRRAYLEQMDECHKFAQNAFNPNHPTSRHEWFVYYRENCS